MATESENLKLKLDDPDDFYNIETQNNNLIKIDEAVGNIDGLTAGVSGELSAHDKDIKDRISFLEKGLKDVKDLVSANSSELEGIVVDHTVGTGLKRVQRGFHLANIDVPGGKKNYGQIYIPLPYKVDPSKCFTSVTFVDDRFAAGEKSPIGVVAYVDSPSTLRVYLGDDDRVLEKGVAFKDATISWEVIEWV